MKITISNIAEKTGFSNATISRALSGKKHIKKETYDTIMKCAQELNYKKRTVLKPSKSINAKIMLIVGDLTNISYNRTIKSIVSVLRQYRHIVAIFDSDFSPSQEEEYVQFAAANNYDGIIMMTPIETPNLINILKKIECPVVLVNRYIRSMELNTVCIDNYLGACMAIEYLLKKGHKRIAHLAGPKNSTACQDRLAGYKDTMEGAGLSVENEAIYYGDLKTESGQNFAKHYLEKLNGYTAVFCANDIMAVGFIEYISQNGIRVPEDISVICFDDSYISTGRNIRLTTVSNNVESMGEAAADMMIKALKEPAASKCKIVFPPLLKERESVNDISEL